MSTTTVNRLMQAVAVLVVIYALVLFSQSRQTTSGIPMPANLSGIKTASDMLAVDTGTTTVELTREKSDWFIGKDKVKLEKVEAVLGALESLEFSRVVSESGDDAADYGLSGEIKSISVHLNNKELRKIEIGRSSGVNRFYARLAGKKPVYEARGNLAELLNEPVSLWIEAPKSGAESSATGSVDALAGPDSTTLP